MLAPTAPSIVGLPREYRHRNEPVGLSNRISITTPRTGSFTDASTTAQTQAPRIRIGAWSSITNPCFCATYFIAAFHAAPVIALHRPPLEATPSQAIRVPDHLNPFASQYPKTGFPRRIWYSFSLKNSPIVCFPSADFASSE